MTLKEEVWAARLQMLAALNRAASAHGFTDITNAFVRLTNIPNGAMEWTMERWSEGPLETVWPEHQGDVAADL